MIDHDIIREIFKKHEDDIRNKNFDKLFLNSEVRKANLIEFLINELGVNPLDYMTAIPSYMFSNNVSIDTLKIPGNIQKIYQYGIYQSNIKHIIIEEGLRELQPRSISNNSQLIDVIIENGPRIIPNKCFEDDQSLRKVFIPKTVRNIEYQAFPEQTFVITPYRENEKDRLKVPQSEIEWYKKQLRFTHEKEVNEE